jgi:hypothetical protein
MPSSLRALALLHCHTKHALPGRAPDPLSHPPPWQMLTLPELDACRAAHYLEGAGRSSLFGSVRVNLITSCLCLLHRSLSIWRLNAALGGRWQESRVTQTRVTGYTDNVFHQQATRVTQTMCVSSTAQIMLRSTSTPQQLCCCSCCGQTDQKIGSQDRVVRSRARTAPRLPAATRCRSIPTWQAEAGGGGMGGGREGRRLHRRGVGG